MSSYNYQQAASAPPMYPRMDDNRVPLPPTRMDLQRNPPEESLLPKPPQRMDKPLPHAPGNTIFRRDDNEENDGSLNNDSACNYNRYATKLTIGHVLLVLSLLFCNIMQLRTLALQKQRDGIWISCVVLASVSILLEIILSFVFYTLIKGDIRNPRKQLQLARYNNWALVLIILLSIINILINIFMLTTDPKSFLDTRSLEILNNAF